MPDIIFLTPTTNLPSTIVGLTLLCKANLVTFLKCTVAGEELCPDVNNETFSSRNKNWLTVPAPKIFTCDSSGVDTLRFVNTDYVVSFLNGSVTFTSPPILDTVTANYDFFPFTDGQLNEILRFSLQEISVLIFRPIDENSIQVDYRSAICKRFYTNLLKNLLLEAKDFFSVSVGGRNINKSNIVGQINVLIQQNETQLQEELELLRHYNKTNRVLPIAEITETTTSDGFVGEETTQTIVSDGDII